MVPQRILRFWDYKERFLSEFLAKCAKIWSQGGTLFASRVVQSNPSIPPLVTGLKKQKIYYSYESSFGELYVVCSTNDLDK